MVCYSSRYSVRYMVVLNMWILLVYIAWRRRRRGRGRGRAEPQFLFYLKDVNVEYDSSFM